MALYRCIGSGEEATSITPSNASPVALTADVAVKPTSNGYAISSYNSVTPSNASPVSLTSGDIVKLGGNGKAVESITNVTPSDSSPVTLTSGDIVKLGGNGKAVQNVNSITPSSSAPLMSSGSIYKAESRGYAINNYQIITPSTSGAYFASGFNKMTSSGYAYSQKPKLAVGTFTAQSSRFSVTGVGFKPKYLAVYVAKTNDATGISYIYNEDVSTTYVITGSADGYLAARDLGSSTSYRLYSIDSDGFTINGFSTAAWRGTGYYFALG